MVVMRRFLFYRDDSPTFHQQPALKFDKIVVPNGCDTISTNELNSNSLTTGTTSNKSARRVTLFEGKII